MSHIPSNIEVDRALSAEERSLVQWLLEHGQGDSLEFLAQLPHIRVARLCGCGCASIDFSISGKIPPPAKMRVLSDYQWRTSAGHLCGVFIFERDGMLAGLDLWSIDGQMTPDALPPIGNLVPISTSSQV